MKPTPMSPQLFTARRKITPARHVLNLFVREGVTQRAVAAAVGALPSTVCRWPERPDGIVPSRYHLALLKLARQHGVAVSAQTLIHGTETKR